MKKTIAYSFTWREAARALQETLNNKHIQVERVDFEFYEAFDGENTIGEKQINEYIAKFLNTGTLAGYAHENGILFIEQ